MSLPPFPVDDTTLDLIDKAINPGPEAERSSLWDLCELYSQLGGSDTTAVEGITGDVQTMRDPAYSHMDIIDVLVREVRRLRALDGEDQP